MVKASGTGGQFAIKAKEEARSTGVMSWNHRRMVLCKLSAKRTDSLENRMFVSQNSVARDHSCQVKGLEPLWLLVCVGRLTENSQDKEQWRINLSCKKVWTFSNCYKKGSRMRPLQTAFWMWISALEQNHLYNMNTTQALSGGHSSTNSFLLSDHFNLGLSSVCICM